MVSKLRLRLIAAILTTVLCLEMFPAAAFAEPIITQPVITPPVSVQPQAEVQSAGIILKMRETLGIMTAQSAEPDMTNVIDASGSLRLVEVAGEKTLEEALAEYDGNPAVEYAEPNYILRTQISNSDLEAAIDDPRYVANEQWGLKRLEGTYAWSVGLGALFDAAEEGVTNPYDLNGNGLLEVTDDVAGLYSSATPVVVAVVDTGVDASHEDLVGRLLPGRNVILDNAASQDDSKSGHGTHIAGIIAANTGNGKGIAGTTGEYPVKVLPVKALDSAGIGTMFDVAEAIRWAVDEGNAKIINLSLGARLFDFPKTLAEAVEYAQNRGAVVVAAAGNESSSVTGFYPACLPGVISVGASTSADSRASFSNWGYSILAPGEGIMSTLPIQDTVHRYGVLSGTSQASAFVSGAAALMLSVFPGLTPAEVSVGLDKGQAPPSYSAQFYILSAGKALMAAYNALQAPLVDKSFEFTSPTDDSRVTGAVDLTVKVADPSVVNRIEFSHRDTLIGTVVRENIMLGGYATFVWDTTTVADGYYSIDAESYDDVGNLIWWYSIGVVVANTQETGLVIDVVNPHGQPASGALVTVHHAYKGLPYEWSEEETLVYQELWNGNADLNGRVMIPSSIATSGNDYLVTARGTNPAYFYWQIVRAPNTEVRLTSQDAATVTVSAYGLNGVPLTGADVSVEMLGVHLPGLAQPGDVIDFGEYDNETNLTSLVKIDALGQGSVTMTYGSYNVRVTREEGGYHLCSYGVLVDQTAETVEIKPQPGELSVLRFAPDPNCSSAILRLSSESDPHVGTFGEMTAGDEITISPGNFSGTATVVYQDAVTGKWTYVFDLNPLTTMGGETEIRVGTTLSATVEPSLAEQSYHAGGSTRLALSFRDSHGNTVSRVTKGSSWQFPQLQVQRTDGEPLTVSTSTWSGDAWWGIPQEIILGDYTVKCQADLGYFGHVESAPLPITIQPPVQVPSDPTSDLTATFLYNGHPLVGLEVYLARCVDGLYYLDSNWYPSTGTDGRFQINIGPSQDGELSVGDKIALIGYGSPSCAGWPSEQPVRPVFVVETLTVGEFPMSVTVDVGALHKVNLSVYDSAGVPVSPNASRPPQLSMYRYEVDGTPVGFTPPWQSFANPLEIWVEEGDYLFQASQTSSSWGPSPVYCLTERVTVTGDTPVQGLEVSLNASEAVELIVSPPQSDLLSGDGTAIRYMVPAIAIYPPGVTRVPVFGLGYYSGGVASDLMSSPVYVSPGDYRLEVAMTRSHVDGLWCYWLTTDGYVTVSPDTPYTWTLGDAFDGAGTTLSSVPSAKTDFGIDETVQLEVHIEDGCDNRLVGMALDLRYLGSVVPSSLDPEVQTHKEIAPFITVLGPSPDGAEVHHYKEAGANYGYLEDWDAAHSENPSARLLDSRSTFFSGEYLIPKDALGGEYTAAMELELGPDSTVRRTVTLNVLAAHAAPRLDTLLPFTNSQILTVTGTTVAGAEVALYSSFNAGESMPAGTATADETGRFSIDVPLQSEGTYEFTAASTVGQTTSTLSAPVSVKVDRQAPGPVRGLLAESQDASHVKITWIAPDLAETDLSGIVSYRIRRNGEVVANDVTPGENPEWQDTGLSPLTEYTYDVRAVDGAGNEGEAALVTVTTVSDLDPIRPTPPRDLTATLTGFRTSLQWEPASDNIGVVGYKVYRSVKGAEPPVVADWTIDDPDAVSFADPDYLDSSTTYVYAVVAYDAAQNESITEGQDVNNIPAAVAEVTTRAIMITGVQWSAPRAKNGLLNGDDDAQGNRPVLQVTATGDANRTGKAEVMLAGSYVNLSDDDPLNDGTYLIDLSEDLDGQGLGLGVYRGSLSIPYDTASILAITCSLADSTGKVASFYGHRLPEDFAPTLKVTVESDHPQSASLVNAALKVWSDCLETGGVVVVNGVGTYFLEGLPPAVDYSLTLTTAGKVVIAEETGLVLNAGEENSVVVRPLVPATFRIRVLRGDGGAALGSSVAVTRADGTPLAQGAVYYDGWTNLVLADDSPLSAGTQIVVSTTPSSAWALHHTGVAGLRFTLSPDANDFVVTLPARPTASLNGKVTIEQDPGIGLAGVSISAYQAIEGKDTLVNRATSDAAGNYSLDVCAGPVRLVANYYRWSMSKEVQIELPLAPDEVRQCDIEMPITKAVSLTVNTKRIGEPAYAMDMDWRVAVHLHLTITNLGTLENPKNVSVGSRGVEDGLVQISDGEPGDRIRIVADGYECNMTKDTVEVVLDADGWARAEVNLIEKGTIKARVRDVNGNTNDGLPRYAELFKVEEQGARFIETLKSSEETVTSKALDDGTYSLVFHWDPLPSVINVGETWVAPLENLEYLKTYLAGNGVTLDNLCFTDDPVLDAGTVRLPVPAFTSPGYFRGTEGNDLVPSKYDAGPGGIITMRGSYRYAGGVSLVQPKICFGIPYRAQLVEGSVVVTPEEGSIDPPIAIRPDAVELSFGSYAREAFSGVVTYRVRMPDDPDTAVCEARMWAEHRTAGRSTTEDIATVAINVPYVSIVAPAIAWDPSRETEVSGKATPFATVRVYDVNYFLAETTASESGVWKATVVLPDRGRRANHYLRAEVVIAASGGDTTGPAWTAGAEVTASDVKSESLTLSWPQAQDEAGVVQYIATGYHEDGSVGAARAAFPTGGAGNVSVTFDGLAAGTNYLFKVEAADASYNWSVPLTRNVTTSQPDTEPPTWLGDRLTASEVKFYSMRLNWPEATDNEGMKEYAVSCVPAAGTLLRPVTVPAGTESLLVEGLSRDTTYQFTVVARDVNGRESLLRSTLATLRYDTEPPVWPSGQALTAEVLDTEVTLTWPTALDNVQISSYPISRKDPGRDWQQAYLGYGNSYTVRQLVPETTYSFRVDAQDAGGNRTAAPSEITVTTTSRDRTPPAWSPDAQVTVSQKTQSGFTLSWPVPVDVSGVRSYKVRDSSLAQGMVHTPSTNSLRLTGLTRGETYTFTVLSQDTRGNWTPDTSGLTISVVVQPDDQTPPSWPAGSILEIPEVGPNNAELVWTPATFDIDQTGLPSYLLQARDGSGAVVFGTTVGYGIGTWSVGALQPGMTYTVSVEAIDEWGNVSTNGPKQVIATPVADTQAPRWPQGAVLSAYGMQKAGDGKYVVLFNWPQALDFGLYHYEMTAKDRLGQSPPSSPTITQQTAWHMWGLNPAETYTVEVKALDLSGNVSAALSATVITPGGLSGASLGAASLMAQSDPPPRTVSSAVAKVEYDQDAVRIESVTMRQTDGRVMQFAPVGKFAYVFVPGLAFNFDVKFNKPERVSELRVLADNGAQLGGTISAPANPGAMLGVIGSMSGAKSIPGKLYASYGTTPSAFSVSDLPSFDREVESSFMPNPWRDVGKDAGPIPEGSQEYQDDKLRVTYGYDDAAKDSGYASVEAKLADPRMHVDVDYTFTQVLGVDPPEPAFSFSMAGDRATFSATVAVDSSVITGQMGGQGWLDTPKVLVRVLGDCWVSGGLSVADLISTVSGANDLQNYELDLDDLLLGMSADCPAADMNRYREQVEMEKSAARQRTVAKCALSLGSLALGVAIPGLGFAIGSFVGGKILEEIIDGEQEEAFNNIKNGIEMNDFCKPKKREWKKDLIADPTWILDPAGYVYEVVPENRVSGVTATALQSVGGTWNQWDATWYDQDNPLVTDAEGRYAWDVPEGKWKVSFEKDGYLPAESWEMDVPPPHTEVNIAMVTTQRPAVASVAADSGAGVDVTFDKYMRAATITAGTITVTELNGDGSVRTDTAGAPVTVSGVVQAIESVADPSDPAITLARAFRFVPATPLVIGDKYRVSVAEVVESYTGLSMAGEHVVTATATLVVPVSGVQISRESVTLPVGTSTTLSAVVAPADATDSSVSWSTSNASVATVNGTGVVTAVSVGTATITVTTGDGGFTDTCSVSVVAPAPAPAGDPVGGGGGGGAQQPQSSAAIVAQETHTVGPEQTTLSVMDGILTLVIPAGTFPPGTELIVSRLKDQAVPTDSSLYPVASPTYEIVIQGPEPTQPVTLGLMYCSLCLKGMDPRKLGIYGEDASNPGNYVYLGGVVDESESLILTTLSAFSRYVVLGRDVTFDDIATHWGRSEIEALAARGLIEGVGDGQFEPNRLITRAELAKLLVGMLAQDRTAGILSAALGTSSGLGVGPTFADVSPDAWYYSVVEIASARGLIRGDGGLFRPDDPVTRQEMAVMLARALGSGYPTPAGGAPFADGADISTWASDSVTAAWYWGLMNGVGDNAFQPRGGATRAMAAAVTLRALELQGFVSERITVSGQLTVSDVEGRHYELVGSDGALYVLLPQTEEARVQLVDLEEVAAGSAKVTVVGMLSNHPNAYMRGRIMKVLSASAAK